MPHTNNPQAKARKAARAGPKPKFLQRIKKSKGNASAIPLADENGNPIPSTSTETASESSTNNATTHPKESRQVKAALIAEYHALEKQLASPALTDPLERKKLLNRQKELGGLSAYQAASVHGGDKVRGGESGKWCVQQLKELKIGVEDRKGKQKEKIEPKILEDGTKIWPKLEREKLRLLDVGAIGGTAYSVWPWIETTSIDLNPQAEHVLKFNFFDFPPPTDSQRLYDVVSLSLVLNFEGSLLNRSLMLRRAHQFLKPGGLLYLVLPLPCLTNSRYMTHERLRAVLTSTGWKEVRQHDSAKLTYWLCSRIGDGRGDGKSWKKEEIRSGVHRNNFCIIVNGEGESADAADTADTAEEEWAGIDPTAAEAEAEEWGGIAEEAEAEEWNGISQ